MYHNHDSLPPATIWRKKQGIRTYWDVDLEKHEKSINLTASWAETEAFEFWWKEMLDG